MISVSNAEVINGKQRIFVIALNRFVEEGETVPVPTHHPTLVGYGEDTSRLCSSTTGRLVMIERLTLECEGCAHEFA